MSTVSSSSIQGKSLFCDLYKEKVGKVKQDFLIKKNENRKNGQEKHPTVFALCYYDNGNVVRLGRLLFVFLDLLFVFLDFLVEIKSLSTRLSVIQLFLDFICVDCDLMQ